VSPDFSFHQGKISEFLRTKISRSQQFERFSTGKFQPYSEVPHTIQARIHGDSRSTLNSHDMVNRTLAEKNLASSQN